MTHSVNEKEATISIFFISCSSLCFFVTKCTIAAELNVSNHTIRKMECQKIKAILEAKEVCACHSMTLPKNVDSEFASIWFRYPCWGVRVVLSAIPLGKLSFVCIMCTVIVLTCTGQDSYRILGYSSTNQKGCLNLCVSVLHWTVRVLYWSKAVKGNCEASHG